MNMESYQEKQRMSDCIGNLEGKKKIDLQYNFFLFFFFSMKYYIHPHPEEGLFFCRTHQLNFIRKLDT